MLKKTKAVEQISFSSYGIAISSITICNTQGFLFAF